MAKSKYTKREINETRSLLKVYFEANLENPDDKIHEILQAFCNKENIYMSQLPVLKKLSAANKKIAQLETATAGGGEPEDEAKRSLEKQ